MHISVFRSLSVTLLTSFYFFISLIHYSPISIKALRGRNEPTERLRSLVPDLVLGQRQEGIKGPHGIYIPDLPPPPLLKKALKAWK